MRVNARSEGGRGVILVAGCLAGCTSGGAHDDSAMLGVAPSVDSTPRGSSSSETDTDVGASSSTDDNVASTVPAGSDETAGIPVMPNDDGNGGVAVQNEIDDSGVVQVDDVGVPVPVQPSGNNDGSIILTVDSGSAAAGSVTFQRIELTREFLAEGANGGDFDRDGVMDVVAGPYLYRGPDFKSRHVVYLPQSESEPVPFDVENYSDHFFSFVDDFNGDGWPDLLVIDFPGRGARWYENPQTLDTVWPRHAVFDAVGNESPAYVDINADGQRELVFASDGALGWAAPSTVPTEPWVFQALTPSAGFGPYDHGLGVSDVDGDGDMDLIEPSGWWEQPDNETTNWTQHEHSFGNGGAQMFAYDVDGDGDQDVPRGHWVTSGRPSR